MSCGRDISAFVWLRWTIEIKLQAVFLHSIDVIERDGDRIVRKSLNAFGNGTRGLRGVDDGRGETNASAYAYDDGEHGGGNVGPGCPEQVVMDGNGGRGESGKNQQSADNSVSGGKQNRKLSFFAAVGGQIFRDQERSGGNGGQDVAGKLGLRCAEKQDGHEHPDEKK